MNRVADGTFTIPRLEVVGAAALGIALGASPKWVAVPSAFIGGAGAFQYLEEVRSAASHVLPPLFDPVMTPERTRKIVASEVGPLAAKTASMAVFGVITSGLTSHAASRLERPNWLRMRRAKSEFEIGEESNLSDFRSYKLPHVDLRYFAPTSSSHGRLHHFDVSKLRQTGFGENSTLVFSPYQQLTNDAAKHSLIKRFQPSHSSPDGYVRVPILPRQYSNVALGIRPKDHSDSKLYEFAKDSIVQVHGVGRDNEVWSGSGFFVEKDGKIATALHVVADAKKLQVTSSDGTKYDAALIAHDFDSDTAILKLKSLGTTFKPLQLAAPHEPLKGDVFLFGHPAGSKTMFMSPGLFHRKGYERAYLSPADSNQILYRGRVFETRAYFLHDRKGNSGGPVLNSDGKVIALHTDGDLHACSSYDEVRVGVGAASSELHKLLNNARRQEISQPQVWRPYLLFPRQNGQLSAKSRWWSFLLP
jgi:S1-C subfamily serine protease